MNNEKFPFFSNNIRRFWQQNEWWFSIEDLLLNFIEISKLEEFLHKIIFRDEEFQNQYGKICHTLEANTGFVTEKLICTNLEGIFRIIQLIESPKAEPFKLWLAKLGKERINELANPN